MPDAPKQPNPEAVRRGAVIHALREAYGISAIQLAEKVGISRRYLSYIEAGEKLAPVSTCRQIADILGVPLAAITVEHFASAGAAS